MKRILGSVVVALVLIAAPQAGATTILDTAIYNGHTYLLLSEGTWSQGEAFAVSQGGHLATVNDAAEQSFLWSHFGPQRTDIGLWIGFNDQASEGNFVWTSGETPGFTFWGPGEPNNLGNEDFASLDVRFNGGGGWNDTGETGNGAGYRGIAEVVPEPSSLLLLGTGALLLRRVRGRR
jgi:hypothetical protein